MFIVFVVPATMHLAEIWCNQIIWLCLCQNSHKRNILFYCVIPHDNILHEYHFLPVFVDTRNNPSWLTTASWEYLLSCWITDYKVCIKTNCHTNLKTFIHKIVGINKIQQAIALELWKMWAICACWNWPTQRDSNDSRHQVYRTSQLCRLKKNNNRWLVAFCVNLWSFDFVFAP